MKLLSFITPFALSSDAPFDNLFDASLNKSSRQFLEHPSENKESDEIDSSVTNSNLPELIYDEEFTHPNEYNILEIGCRAYEVSILLCNKPNFDFKSDLSTKIFMGDNVKIINTRILPAFEGILNNYIDSPLNKIARSALVIDIFKVFVHQYNLIVFMENYLNYSIDEIGDILNDLKLVTPGSMDMHNFKILKSFFFSGNPIEESKMSFLEYNTNITDLAKWQIFPHFHIFERTKFQVSIEDIIHEPQMSFFERIGKRVAKGEDIVDIGEMLKNIENALSMSLEFVYASEVLIHYFEFFQKQQDARDYISILSPETQSKIEESIIGIEYVIELISNTQSLKLFGNYLDKNFFFSSPKHLFYDKIRSLCLTYMADGNTFTHTEDERMNTFMARLEKNENIGETLLERRKRKKLSKEEDPFVGKKTKKKCPTCDCVLF